MDTSQTTTKQSEVKRVWHHVDVDNKVLGRMATDIALKLRGKSKSYFVPHLDCGDYVVVTNAANVRLTGNKEEQKTYTRYSGYPGGQESENVKYLRARKPEEIVRRAVSGMLPKNKLRAQWLKRLYIFPENEHPYKNKLK